MAEKKIEGFVKRITFRNAENGYTVLSISDKDGKEACLVGSFSSVAEGEYLQAEGNEVEHPKYGKQLKVTSYKMKVPEDTFSMERYLGSGAIKGVGVALAARIIRKFGKDTFKIIENEPERLAEVKGISKKMAISISNQFNEKQVMRNAMLFLQDYNLSMNLALKIYNKYGEELYDIMKNNPYRLAEDIQGVGFQIADSIAKKAGFSDDSEFRIRAGIEYVLQEATLQGNCYLPEGEVKTRTKVLLGVSEPQIAAQLENLMFEKNIVCIEKEEERLLYKTYMYYKEMNCARMLVDLNIDFPSDEREIQKRLKRIEKQQNIVLDDKQRDAVIKAACNGVTIVTGGPGTGKTTTINTIIQILEEENLEILLAAPTGRAAKRMTETTGREAQTIHRLLEINRNSDDSSDGRDMRFERNEENPLETDAVIVDEMSMVDIHLMNALLRAVVPGTRLIMVGDCNQLPSVGPGNVLKDMIQAAFCPVVCLDKIFRQAAESDIIMNAHKINVGESIKMNNQSKDFFFFQRETTHNVKEVMLWLIMKSITDYVKASTYDIQVLTPMRKGELGVDALNVFLQHYMNPESPDKVEKEFHSVLFRENDKIMQVKNDYQLAWKKENDFGDTVEEGSGVFNGDCGIIRKISEVSETVEIEFEEGKTVVYPYGSMEEIELAYAITIHKSQGSEYPAVILPLLGGPRMLFNRNLLYTAVTRAKKCVCLIGEQKVINAMIANNNEQLRYSSLAERIKEVNG